MNLGCRFCFLFLFHSFLIKATIIDMEEWYSRRLNQTVILLGDCHSELLPDKDQVQLDEIMNAVALYNPYIFIEGADDDESGVLLLHKFHQACKKKQLSYSCIDFRKASKCLLSYKNEALEKYKSSINKIKEVWQDEPYKGAIPAFISLEMIESWDVLQDLINYQGLLKYCGDHPNKSMIEQLEEAKWFSGKISACSRIFEGLKNTHSDILPVIVDNTFIDGSETATKKDSIFQILHDISCDVFDLRIVAEIHKKWAHRVVFVMAGQQHTHNVGEALQKLGYVVKNKIINHNNDKIIHYILVDVADIGVSSSNYPGNCVDIGNFFKRCDSLTQSNNIFNFMTGCIAGGCLASILILYKMRNSYWAYR